MRLNNSAVALRSSSVAIAVVPAAAAALRTKEPASLAVEAAEVALEESFDLLVVAAVEPAVVGIGAYSAIHPSEL